MAGNGGSTLGSSKGDVALYLMRKPDVLEQAETDVISAVKSELSGLSDEEWEKKWATLFQDSDDGILAIIVESFRNIVQDGVTESIL